VKLLSFYSARGCGITGAFIYACKGKASSLETWIGPVGLQEVVASGMSRKSAHQSDKFVRPTHRPPLTPRDNPFTHFF